MENIAVEITCTCVTAQYGTLTTGDVLRTSQAFADHLVNEAYCAKYVGVAEIEGTPPAAKTAKKATKSAPTEPTE
jgi:hypothetical protein